MPLYENAVESIRANLEAIQRGRKARAVAIGTLTDAQLEAINRHRLAQNASLPRIEAEVVFVGAHIYRSRIERDGYTIDDVLAQIESAMSEASALVGNLPMQAIESPVPRADRLGNTIYDRAVFECMSRHPRPELYSVIPKGDRIKPEAQPEKQKGRPQAALQDTFEQFARLTETVRRTNCSSLLSAQSTESASAIAAMAPCLRIEAWVTHFLFPKL